MEAGGQSLLSAAREGDLNQVTRLVTEAGVDPNFQDGTSALHMACKNNHLDVVQYLVEKAQVDVHAVDLDGSTALHSACFSSEGDTLPLVKYLMEHAGLSESVDAKTIHGGYTPLHVAAWVKGNTDTVRYLVETQNADLYTTNEHGRQPVYIALHFDRCDKVEYLLSKMESVNRKMLSNPFFLKTKWPIRETIIEKFAAGQNQCNQFAKYPIHTFLKLPLPMCFRNEAFAIACIKELVENRNADPDATDQDGETPLYLTVSSPYFIRLTNDEYGVTKYLLSIVEHVDARALNCILTRFFSKTKCKWPIRQTILEKYAAGEGQSAQFAKTPIHTLMQFPLRTGRLFKCIEHFPKSSLSTLDGHGRWPIHVLLTSSNTGSNNPWFVHRLLELEPRSALVRDPTTGWFPYQAASLLAVEDSPRGESYNTNAGLSSVYELLRGGDPAGLLRGLF